MNKILITMPLLLISVVLIITGCGRQERSTDIQDSTRDTAFRPDAEVRGATIFLYEAGDVTTEIRASLIHKFDDIDSTMAYDLDIDIMEPGGEIASNVVGDSGIIREASNTLHLYGQVVVLTNDSTKLETNFLRWNPRQNKIQTDAFVKITKNGDIVTGWGMESDRRLSRIKILRHVSGSVDEAVNDGNR